MAEHEEGQVGALQVVQIALVAGGVVEAELLQILDEVEVVELLVGARAKRNEPWRWWRLLLLLLLLLVAL